MTYRRPKSEVQLSPEEKRHLLSEYHAFYQAQAQDDKANLNKKVPREAFAAVIDEVGEMLLRESSEMAKNNPRIRDFLDETPLPQDLEKLLPEEFRVFCLMLNALKQWVAAEQQATDRYLLGGTARNSLRNLTTQCIVTGEEIGPDGELHHPVRDGRPPILLSKRGHSLIERQIAGESVGSGQDKLFDEIRTIKEKGNHSWIKLRKGCMDQLGLPVLFSSPGMRSSSRTFAKKIHDELGLSYQEILDWLDEHQLAVS